MTTARLVTTIYECVGLRSRSIVVTTLAVVMVLACISHDDIRAAFQVVSHTRPAQATIREAVQQENGALVLVASAVIMNGDTIGLHITFKPLCHVMLLLF